MEAADVDYIGGDDGDILNNILLCYNHTVLMLSIWDLLTLQLIMLTLLDVVCRGFVYHLKLYRLKESFHLNLPSINFNRVSPRIILIIKV